MDDVTKTLRAWERPEPSADLADRIIAAAGEQARPVRVFPRLALVASLVLAVAIGYTLTQPNAPVQQAVTQQADSIDGIPLLADVDLMDSEDDFAFLDDEAGYEL